ncbi:LuxR C-terminal-related transcriptional regulator [Streptomyces globisporus]|uniref:LuxR C-terminal-related transcriptional regulator n=1 Tax=Streptomyces globisporus TaxID=1908 RepID=UPI00365AD3ED
MSSTGPVPRPDGTVRVLLAPGHSSLFTAGIASALGRTPGIRLLTNGQAAREEPDVVLVEDAPGVPVDEAIARLPAPWTAGPPGARRPRIIVMLRDDRVERILDYLRSDVRGFVCHNAPLRELVTAVRVVFRNEAFLPYGIAALIIEGILPHLPRPDPGPSPSMSELTPREREIFRLMASGISNAEIADACSLSQKTVKFHVSNILRKLGMKNRIQAVVRARGVPCVSA